MIVVCGKICGKICGNIKSLSDWRIFFCVVVDIDPPIMVVVCGSGLWLWFVVVVVVFGSGFW